MRRIAPLLCLLFAVLLLTAAGSEPWLAKVPPADRTAVNPVAGKAADIAAGENLYKNSCARCHGFDGKGKASRPPVRSAEVAAATDGELFWLLKNGEPFRGMPAWASIPEPERWQIIAYLRSIQAPAQNVPVPVANPLGVK